MRCVGTPISYPHSEADSRTKLHCRPCPASRRRKHSQNSTSISDVKGRRNLSGQNLERRHWFPHRRSREHSRNSVSWLNAREIRAYVTASSCISSTFSQSRRFRTRASLELRPERTLRHFRSSTGNWSAWRPVLQCMLCAFPSKAPFLAVGCRDLSVTPTCVDRKSGV